METDIEMEMDMEKDMDIREEVSYFLFPHVYMTERSSI